MQTIAGKSTKKSYDEILRSTFIMGASSVITSLLSILRIKVLALLIGPAGVGLMGIYLSTANLLTAVSGMGVDESGVRQIASDNSRRGIAVTVFSIRRAVMAFGAAGLCFLLIFRHRVSLWTFGNGDHAYDLALMSLTVLFGTVSGGQIALIQGMRRIGDLARINILGGLWGTMLSIPIIYVLETRGIAIFLLAASGAYLLTCWWYARKIDIPRIAVSWRSSLAEAGPLLRLGFAFMIASLMSLGTTYILRVIVLHYHGMAATGIYQAAATLSSIYVAVILRAMFTDFYPRLTAAAGDGLRFSKLVNEQIEVGILLAAPGILATLTAAPLVILAFYSSEFMLSVDILRWQILGVFLQVISWPMGFMLRAKGNRKLFLWSESFGNAVHLGFAWAGITWFGLSGVGMAFLAMNVSYGLVIYLIVRRRYGFAFSPKIIRFMTIFGGTAAAVFLAPYPFPQSHLTINVVLTIAAGVYCLKSLISSTGALPGILLKIKSRYTC